MTLTVTKRQAVVLAGYTGREGARHSRYHNASGQHLLRYRAQHCYRVNLAAMLPRLAWAALRTPPISDRLPKLARVDQDREIPRLFHRTDKV